MIDIVPRNTGSTEAELQLLNDCVGAEHAQKTRTPPNGFDKVKDNGLRCASLDGDADRLVYHYYNSEGQWKLLDGDKIATLAAVFLSEQLAKAGFTITGIPSHPHTDNHTDNDNTSIAALSSSSNASVSVGVVQTAYANGASTAYIKNKLGLPVPLAKTGVKFVHHVAQEFDIGVYFEANGHGTVLFHDEFLNRLRNILSNNANNVNEEQKIAVRRLLTASKLINQAIGDALSDAIFVEAVLCLKGYSIQDWDAFYNDLPSYQSKIVVKDRTVIITTEDETRVVSPAELQVQIDSLVSPVENGRAFVRPSGTEDAVRVYAEASTEDEAKRLGICVLGVTFDIAGGIGTRPSL